MKPASVVAAVLLSLVAIAHLLRLILRVEITADGVDIPMWLSVAGSVVPAAVAFWLWREQRKP